MLFHIVGDVRGIRFTRRESAFIDRSDDDIFEIQNPGFKNTHELQAFESISFKIQRSLIDQFVVKVEETSNRIDVRVFIRQPLDFSKQFDRSEEHTSEL